MRLVTVPFLNGEIPEQGVVTLLTQLEATRVSGVLKFKSDAEGQVQLVQGQLAADQDEREDDYDVVELLLEAKSGTYEVFQELPSLPVSRGDKLFREGSLEVHVPADLMNYCERAGLTGLLKFDSEGRSAEVAYDAGEMSAIRLEGAEELHQVFGWEHGSFRVEAQVSAPDLDDAGEDGVPEAKPKVPSAPPEGRDNTSQHFLKVMEFTLSDIIREREERRPATRTSPPLPPQPKTNANPSLPAPKKRKEREDQTVKVFFRNKEAMPIAPIPEPSLSKSSIPPKKNPSPKADSKAANAQSGPTMLWVLVLIAVVFAALVLLSSLPALD
ncbi:MAG: hypothetical protein ACI9KE_000284 [Polyangiales bacterium]|jgi:hypothetical protein